MTFSRFFFLLSFVFFALFLILFYEQNNPQQLSFAKESTFESNTDIKVESSEPSGIVIPSIHVWLPVYKAKLQNGNWETSNKGISYLVSSAPIGVTGNAIFYGHDWPNLLGNLKNVHTGDTIKIISKTGREFTYQVSTIQEVNPTDVSVLAPTKDTRLTLYTCSGFLDSKRLVVVAIRTS